MQAGLREMEAGRGLLKVEKGTLLVGVGCRVNLDCCLSIREMEWTLTPLDWEGPGGI